MLRLVTDGDQGHYKSKVYKRSGMEVNRIIHNRFDKIFYRSYRTFYHVNRIAMELKKEKYSVVGIEKITYRSLSSLRWCISWCDVMFLIVN